MEYASANSGSSASIPIDSSNIGFKLLKKHGWKEGTGLGVSEQGMLEPIQAYVKKNKRGLGADMPKKATEPSKHCHAEPPKDRLEPIQAHVKKKKRGLKANKRKKATEPSKHRDVELPKSHKRKKKGLSKKMKKMQEFENIYLSELYICWFWLNGNCLNANCGFRHPGSEFDYRHSEIARVDPRDCWFWLNGNCLNTKCGFRHPPLDGLIGAEVPKLPTPQIQNTSVRQAVPCVFFQKGFCGKGDWCPFMHAPNPMSNNKTSLTPEPSTIKKTLIEPEKQENKVVPPPVNVSSKKPIEVPPQLSKLTSPNRKISQSQTHIDEFIDENPSRWSPRMNLNDPEEFSREPSPGFDVLVDDDEQRDSDYCPTVGRVDESDLRHRLAEHKKANGLRSVIIHDNDRVEDRMYHDTRREENSLSSRLRGRIRSSSPSDRDINCRINDHNDRRDHVTDQQSLGKRKHDAVHQESGNGISFEGPKLLEEILKRKRGGGNSSKNVENDQIEGNDNGSKIEAKETVQLPDDASKVESEEAVVFEAGYEQEEGGGDSDFYAGDNGEAKGE